MLLKDKMERRKKKRESHCREVNGHRQDDKRHNSEDSLHCSQVGVVYTRLCSQLKSWEIDSEEADMNLTYRNQLYNHAKIIRTAGCTSRMANMVPVTARGRM